MIFDFFGAEFLHIAKESVAFALGGGGFEGFERGFNAGGIGVVAIIDEGYVVDFNVISAAFWGFSLGEIGENLGEIGASGVGGEGGG